MSVVVSGANRHDSAKLGELLDRKVLRQEDGDASVAKNLCLDAAYVGKESVARAHGYTPHIRPRGEEKVLIAHSPAFKARRWVVELSHSWFNRFGKLCPRYEKTDRSYEALIALAAAMITLNKVMSIYR